MSEVTVTTLFGAAEPVAGPKGSRVFRRTIGRLVLGAADLAAVALALLIGFTALRLLGAKFPDAGMLALSQAMALTVMATGIVFGLNDAAGLDPLERFRRRVMVTLCLPWPGLGIYALASPANFDAICLIALSAAMFLPLSMLIEAVVKPVLIARAAWGADVVLIGSAEDVARVTADLLAQPEIGLRPVGYCADPTERSAGIPIPRLAALTDVASLVDAADIAVVIPSPSVSGLDLSSLPFSRIVLVPEFNVVPAVSVQISRLGRSSGLDFANPSRARTGQFAKRLVDLLIAVPALLFTLPLILITAVAIKLISPGPAFFTQPRVGWRGETVGILKLRSMYTDAAERLEELLRNDPEARREWETYVKLSRDPRILPVIGNFIRRTSIDELPQLWNVVRGDISLVGPRPFPHYHVAKFSPQFQSLRCAVRPGLTGLWQVSDRSGADLTQQESIDTFYIRNWSLWLDLFIVMRTVPAIIAARGAR